MAVLLAKLSSRSRRDMPAEGFGLRRCWAGLKFAKPPVPERHTSKPDCDISGRECGADLCSYGSQPPDLGLPIGYKNRWWKSGRHLYDRIPSVGRVGSGY